MMPNKRNLLKINIWGAPNKFTPKHPAGGYYKHPSQDPANQPKKTPRQRKIDKKKKRIPNRNIKDIA